MKPFGGVYYTLQNSYDCYKDFWSNTLSQVVKLYLHFVYNAHVHVLWFHCILCFCFCFCFFFVLVGSVESHNQQSKYQSQWMNINLDLIIYVQVPWWEKPYQVVDSLFTPKLFISIANHFNQLFISLKYNIHVVLGAALHVCHVNFNHTCWTAF